MNTKGTSSHHKCHLNRVYQGHNHKTVLLSETHGIKNTYHSDSSNFSDTATTSTTPDLREHQHVLSPCPTQKFASSRSIEDTVSRWANKFRGLGFSDLQAFESWHEFRLETGVDAFSSLLDKLSAQSLPDRGYGMGSMRPRLAYVMGAMKQSKELREIVYQIAEDYLAAHYSPLAELGFRKIELAVEVYNIKKQPFPGPALLRCAKKYFRLNEVNNIVRSETGSSLDPNFNSFFGYIWGLGKIGMELPFVIETKRFSSVTDKKIFSAFQRIQAKEDSFEMLNFISNFKPWQDYLQKTYPAEFNSLSNLFTDKDIAFQSNESCLEPAEQSLARAKHVEEQERAMQKLFLRLTFEPFEPSKEQVARALAKLSNRDANFEPLDIRIIFRNLNNSEEQDTQEKIEYLSRLFDHPNFKSIETLSNSDCSLTEEIKLMNQFYLRLIETRNAEVLPQQHNINLYNARPLAQAVASWRQHDETKKGITHIWEWIKPSSPIHINEHWENFQDEEGADAFSLLLDKLHDTADAKRFLGNQTMSRRVSRVLRALKESNELRSICFAHAENVTSSCHDKVEVSFQRIESEVDVYTIQKKSPGELELLKYAKKQFRLNEVMRIADETIKNQPVPDDVEIILAYQLGLKKKGIKLPIETKKMKYGNYSDVTSRDIKMAFARIKKKEDSAEMIDFIAKFEPWQHYLQKTFPTKFEDLNKPFADQADRLLDNRDQMIDEEWSAQNNNLLTNQRYAEKELYLQLTKDAMQRNAQKPFTLLKRKEAQITTDFKELEQRTK